MIFFLFFAVSSGTVSKVYGLKRNSAGLISNVCTPPYLLRHLSAIAWGVLDQLFDNKMPGNNALSSLQFQIEALCVSNLEEELKSCPIFRRFFVSLLLVLFPFRIAVMAVTQSPYLGLTGKKRKNPSFTLFLQKQPLVLHGLRRGKARLRHADFVRFAWGGGGVAFPTAFASQMALEKPSAASAAISPTGPNSNQRICRNKKGWGGGVN